MPYKITIVKTEKIEYDSASSYETIDKRPWTDAELKEASPLYGDKSAFLGKNPLKDIYGYTPTRKLIKEEETKLLEQTVENLDLVAVIKAMNGI